MAAIKMSLALFLGAFVLNKTYAMKRTLGFKSTEQEARKPPSKKLRCEERPETYEISEAYEAAKARLREMMSDDTALSRIEEKLKTYTEDLRQVDQDLDKFIKEMNQLMKEPFHHRTGGQDFHAFFMPEDLQDTRRPPQEEQLLTSALKSDLRKEISESLKQEAFGSLWKDVWEKKSRCFEEVRKEITDLSKATEVEKIVLKLASEKLSVSATRLGIDPHDIDPKSSIKQNAPLDPFSLKIFPVPLSPEEKILPLTRGVFKREDLEKLVAELAKKIGSLDPTRVEIEEEGKEIQETPANEGMREGEFEWIEKEETPSWQEEGPRGGGLRKPFVPKKKFLAPSQTREDLEKLVAELSERRNRTSLGPNEEEEASVKETFQESGFECSEEEKMPSGQRVQGLPEEDTLAQFLAPREETLEEVQMTPFPFSVQSLEASEEVSQSQGLDSRKEEVILPILKPKTCTARVKGCTIF